MWTCIDHSRNWSVYDMWCMIYACSLYKCMKILKCVQWPEFRKWADTIYYQTALYCDKSAVTVCGTTRADTNTCYLYMILFLTELHNPKHSSVNIAGMNVICSANIYKHNLKLIKLKLINALSLFTMPLFSILNVTFTYCENRNIYTLFSCLLHTVTCTKYSWYKPKIF